MSKEYFAGFSLSGSTTFDSDELRRVIQDATAPDNRAAIFTVVTYNYIELARLWAAYLDKLRIRNFFLVCADEASRDVLRAEGRKTLLVQPRGVLLSTSNASLDDSIFPHDIATYAARLKFQIAHRILCLGASAIFSDVDALWLADPQSDLSGMSCDIAFQIASFPEDVKSVWGFTACTGFVTLKPGHLVLDFLDKVNSRFIVDDQSIFNRILLQDYRIKWNAPLPLTDWAHCDSSSGRKETIFGRCETTGLTVAALPHCFYQRHNVTAPSVNHAIICHPNSPLTQQGKLDVLGKLGLYPAEREIPLRSSMTDLDLEELFRYGWGGGAPETVSGAGSTLKYTEGLRPALSRLIKEIGAQTVLDAPCGDFNWMNHVDVHGAHYIGLDIVKEIIQHNIARYARADREFREADITKDKLPDADILICRDLALHLPFRFIARMFDNMLSANIGYFAMSSHVNAFNTDLETPGDSRLFNLAIPPLSLPLPPDSMRLPDWIEGFPERYLYVYTRRDLATALRAK